MYVLRTFVVVGAFLACGSFGAKILGLFPFLEVSHHRMFQAVTDELHRKGHEIVAVTPFPKNTHLKNYKEISLKGVVPVVSREISLKGLEPIVENQIQIGAFNGPLSRSPVMDMFNLFWLLESYEEVLRLKEVQELMSGKERFDLVLTELFNTDMFLGVPYRLGVPFVALSSCAAMPWSYGRFGNPDAPVFFDGTSSTGEETFLQRLSNAVGVWFSKMAYTLIFEPYSQKVAEKYLGPLPPLSEIAKNTSIFLVNTHFSLHKSRPNVPAVVEVGGLHIQHPRELSKDLGSFLNKSKDGVIYFSMGSILRGDSWPDEKKEVFYNVFSKLKQNVLWKWEGDNSSVKSENILTMKWLPQESVLAHPNVVAFITHGGLFSISEAVYYGVPILGVPVFGDQRLNVEAVRRAGAGLALDLDTITERGLSRHIDMLLHDPRYKRNARLLSERFKDRPEKPMDTAVYWIEYVLKHRGAAHLRSSAVDLPSYKYLLLDVIAFVILTIIVSIFIFYIVTRSMLQLVFYKKNKVKSS